MAAAPKDLATLRRMLAERFPTVPRTAGRVLPMGVASFDQTSDGLPLGAITEIVCAAPSCGSQLVLGQLLAATRATRTRVALIDATDSFDPDSFDDDLLAHLVWVRCTSTTGALSAADLLARDANLGLVLLDLRRAPEADLRRTPSTQWYRLQRAVEPTDLALVVQTPRACVPSAHLRFKLHASHQLDVFSRERATLMTELTPLLERQRTQALAG